MVCRPSEKWKCLVLFQDVQGSHAKSSTPTSISTVASHSATYKGGELASKEILLPEKNTTHR